MTALIHMLIAITVLLIAGSVDAHQAGILRGRATVIDGDTIEVRGSRVRLRKIDAPESSQLCHDQQGRAWRCGQQAALALADFISDRIVLCDNLGRDRYRRTLARCRIGRTDLGAWLIGQGWAVSYLDRKGEYRGIEQQARHNRRGIWNGTFSTPSDWRRRNVR